MCVEALNRNTCRATNTHLQLAAPKDDSHIGPGSDGEVTIPLDAEELELPGPDQVENALARDRRPGHDVDQDEVRAEQWFQHLPVAGSQGIEQLGFRPERIE